MSEREPVAQGTERQPSKLTVGGSIPPRLTIRRGASRKGKLIHVVCDEPIGLYRRAEQPWADIYISWTGRPGRTVYRWGPCIQGREYLEYRVTTNEQMLALPEEECEFRDVYARGLAEGRATLARLDAGENFIISDERLSADGIPEIQIADGRVTRESAERALRWLCLRVAGFDLVRFKWHRPKGGVVCPT